MQRFLDIILSCIGLLLVLPIFLLVSLLLKYTGEGEILYAQNRVGRNGKIFRLLKFATMLKNSPNIGSGEVTISNDPRVLPLGKFLRKSKINELPQLWNIFIGEMSIVGPRPMVPNTFSKYSKDAQKILNTVRPGLTGIGSIIFRDEESILKGRKDPIIFYNSYISPYKSELEIWYVQNKKISLNLIIIFVTAWVVIFPSSNIVNKVFKDIPKIPDVLRNY
jgi:lipopolysaccharide/colanic/teichoic acid biosynthesis glycosyltransferase